VLLYAAAAAMAERNGSENFGSLAVKNCVHALHREAAQTAELRLGLPQRLQVIAFYCDHDP
jgi:hypothetical protein